MNRSELKKTKIYVALSTMLMVSSFTAAEDFLAKKAKKANKDIIVCQYKAAIDFDDSISSIRTLAPIIADQCQKESDHLYRIVRSSVNGPIHEEKIRQEMREKDLKMARQVILMKRSDERKAKRQ